MEEIRSMASGDKLTLLKCNFDLRLLLIFIQFNI